MNKIKIFNLSSIIETNDTKMVEYMMDFINKYYISKGGYKDTDETMIFSSYTNDYKEFYFHNKQLKHFSEYLKEKGVSLEFDEVLDKREYEVSKEDISLNPKISLFDYQERAREFLNKPKGSYLLPLQTGKGKCLSYDTKILTKNYILKNISDIKEGDLIYSKDGKIIKVLKKYYSGNLNVYRVIFKDKRYVDSSICHVWNARVYDSNGNFLYEGNFDTYHILNLLNSYYRVKIPTFRLNKLESNTRLNDLLTEYELNVSNLKYISLNDLVRKIMLARYDDIKEFCYKILNQFTVKENDFYIRTHDTDKIYDFIKILFNFIGYNIYYVDKYKIKIEKEDEIEIDFIEDLNISKDMYCIKVDSEDELFSLGNFIVTHNTITSLAVISDRKERFGIIILPMYIDKWVMDVLSNTNIQSKDLMVVKGLDSIKALKYEHNQNAKCYIFSSRTLRMMIKNYEESREEFINDFDMRPIDLIPMLKIGSIIIDETHQHFNSIFKILLHTNVKYHLGLSATLFSDNYIVRRTQRLVYDSENVFKDFEYDRYIDVYALSYTIDPSIIRKIRTTSFGSNKYSHIEFEKSILRNEKLIESYYLIMKEVIDYLFIDEYKKNDKILIFVSTVRMADEILSRLRRDYIHKGFKISRYVEDDPYENLIGSDMVVSTIISSGTAVDIKDLRMVLMSVCINSTVSNFQALGRLRKLSDRDTKFVYIYSDSIPKHISYHIYKRSIFMPKVKSIIEKRIGRTLKI